MGKYKTLARHIIQDIETGTLAIGSKLPSVRSMAKQQQLSITTVLNCYRDLEQSGLITTKPKSGFFVTAKEHEHKLTFPNFDSKVVTLNSGKSLHNSNETDYSFYPFYSARLSPAQTPQKVLAKYLTYVAKNQLEDLMSYASPGGLEQLKQVLATHFTQQGFPLSPQELVINNGCLDSVRLALEATSLPGDVVAVNSPCYSGLLQLVSSMGRKIFEIPAHDQGMDLTQLFHAMQTGQVMVCLLSANHQNPSGLSLSNHQKKAIAHMASELQIPVIEDDVYLELRHSMPLSLPIKAWDKSGHVLWCSSVSKTMAAGMRLGWCAAGRYAKKVQNLRHIQSLGVNHIEQQVLANYIASGQYQKHLVNLRERLFILKNKYRQLLLKYLPPQSKISNPEGGMVLWIQIPGLNTRRFKQRLGELGIFIRTGADFSSRKFYQDCFRLNFSWPVADIEKDLLSLCETVSECLHT